MPCLLYCVMPGGLGSVVFVQADPVLNVKTVATSTAIIVCFFVQRDSCP